SSYAVLDMAAFNANRTGGGGVFTISANGKLRLSGNTGGAATSNAGTTSFPLNYATLTLDPASTAEYYGATQNIYDVPTYGNLTTTTAGTKTAGGNLSIAGNLTINAASTFAGSSYTHSLQGDFLNSGTFTAGTSTMNFCNGTGVLQHIGPAAGTVTTFANLKINTRANVTMLQDGNVSASLILTQGLLNTSVAGSGLLIMLNGSAAPAITALSASYVNGPMQYQKSAAGSTTLNFPVGTSPDCRPFILTVNHSAATQYNYTAQTFNANPWVAMASTYTDMPSTVDTISGVHYWTINRTDAGGTSQPSAGLNGNQQIQLFFGTNDGVYQGSGLTIVKNTAATPATWIDIGGSSTLGNFSSGQAGSVTSTSSPTAFNSFSTFTLGSKNTGWDPLPIELLSFTAVANGDKVDIKWETITETNNAYFTIEKSKDGVNFTKLMDVQGAGTSTTYRNYAEVDYQPYEGTSYYRLKQTDNNGAYQYFTMVPVTFTKDGQQSIILYPNPIDNTTNLQVNVTGYQNQEVVVVLRDMQGREFLSKVLLAEDNGHVFVIDETKSLQPGAYIVTATSNNKIYNYKLIVR
ncbi:MAG TPA: T9SS type A sorting domain-containing protein, partial [Bacteroidia bacterium]|nr:T9SS type A sorting domain-containing protein [Bacteroidia bacterium]